MVYIMFMVDKPGFEPIELTLESVADIHHSGKYVYNIQSYILNS